MVLGKKWLFSIGNGAEIQPLEKGRKSPIVLCMIKGYMCFIILAV